MAAVKLSLETELAVDYMTLRGHDRQLELLKPTVEAYVQAEAVTQRRFAGGIATGIDIANPEPNTPSPRPSLTMCNPHAP